MLRLETAWLLCLSVPSALDVSGVWTGEMQQKTDDGRTAHQAIIFRLKQAGDQITGTAGPDENKQSPIREAKLEGDHLTFSITGADESRKAGAGPTWKFDLKVSGDRIEGKAEGAYGGRYLGTTEVLMSRQK